MYKDDFKVELKKLGEYYGLARIVSDERFEQWFEKLKDIPSEALPWIRSRIEDNSDTLPRNIPKHMRSYYHEWRSSNAAKVMDYPQTGCPECGGDGLLWCRRPVWIEGKQVIGRDGPILEEVSYRCGKCENWKRHCHEKSKPAATVAFLRGSGFEITRAGKMAA